MKVRFKVMERVQTADHRSALQERELPSLARRAVNLVKAAGEVVKSTTEGNAIFVDEETLAARMGHCRPAEGEPCEFWRASDEKCAHPKCGCWMKAKVRLKAMKCPIGKW